MNTLEIESHLISEIGFKHGVSNDEVVTILEGFSIFDNCILSVSHLKDLSAKFVNVQFDFLSQIMNQFKLSFLLFEIEDKRRPDAETRRIVINHLRQLSPIVKHIAFGNGKHTISVNATVFMMSVANITNYSIHQDLEEAKEKLREMSEVC